MLRATSTFTERKKVKPTRRKSALLSRIFALLLYHVYTELRQGTCPYYKVGDISPRHLLTSAQPSISIAVLFLSCSCSRLVLACLVQLRLVLSSFLLHLSLSTSNTNHNNDLEYNRHRDP